MREQLVLIDGENFVHKIVNVLCEYRKIPGREGLQKFDLVWLLHEVLGTSKNPIINYYATKVHVVKSPKELKEKTKAMVQWNAYWAPMLANQGVQYIKSGNLQVRDSKQCEHCGRKSLIMQEKGVDVRIATDILLAANNNADIVLVSSDSDLIPAINAARQLKSSVTYVGFDFALNVGLAASANITKVISKNAIVEAYERVQNG